MTEKNGTLRWCIKGKFWTFKSTGRAHFLWTVFFFQFRIKKTRMSSDEVKQMTLLLVDTESYDRLYLSEIGTIALQFQRCAFTKGWVLSRSKQFHVLIKPPKGYEKKEDHKLYIQHEITGLDPDRLACEGVHYVTGLQRWNDFCDSFSDDRCIKLARDPRLDQFLLKDPHIFEVCDFLHSPFDQLFILRKNRPEDIEQLCHQKNRCSYHSPLAPSKYHCALEDSLIISLWILRYGLFLNVEELHHSVDLCSLVETISSSPPKIVSQGRSSSPLYSEKGQKQSISRTLGLYIDQIKVKKKKKMHKKKA